MTDTQYKGSCKCGNIQFTATGSPKFFGWCHCYRCRIDCSSSGIYETTYTAENFTHNISTLDQNTIYSNTFGPKDSCIYYKCKQCDTRVFDNNRVNNTFNTNPSLFEFARHTDNTAQVKQLPSEWPRQQAHIFYSMRLQGMELDDGVPHYTTNMSSPVINMQTIKQQSTANTTVQHDSNIVYKGQCKCGNIQFSVTGNPIITQYCHCYRCRVADFAEYRVATVVDSKQFTTKIDTVNKNTYIAPLFGPGFEHLQYWRCTQCDTRCYHYNNKIDKYVVYPSTFEFAHGDENNIGGRYPDTWKPKCHIFYGSRLGGHDVDDGLIYYTALRDKEQCDYQGTPIS